MAGTREQQGSLEAIRILFQMMILGYEVRRTAGQDLETTLEAGALRVRILGLTSGSGYLMVAGRWRWRLARQGYLRASTGDATVSGTASAGFWACGIALSIRDGVDWPLVIPPSRRERRGLDAQSAVIISDLEAMPSQLLRYQSSERASTCNLPSSSHHHHLQLSQLSQTSLCSPRLRERQIKYLELRLSPPSWCVCLCSSLQCRGGKSNLLQGQSQSGMGGGGAGDNKDKKDSKVNSRKLPWPRKLTVSLQKDKPKYEPPPQPTTRIGRKKRKAAGPSAAAKLPVIYPTARCKLRYLRMQRIHDHLLLEEEYVENQEQIRKAKAANTATPASAGGDSDAIDRNADERSRVDDMRGTPMGVGNLEEMIDDDHAIVSSATGPEYYVSIMSFVDKDLLEPGASILLHHKSVSVVGVLTEESDPLVSVMKLDKAPTESYADIGGLESQIQEVREAVELPLLHPELYEEMGIKPPKGVILYGAPGTGKTLLAKAVANQTSATFLRIVGSELIQKYLGDGPRLVRQLFQVAAEHAPSIVFIDEIDAIGTKRYESTSGGEREIQRTMLELLNQLDGFDDRGDVKVVMATNKIETLDPALIRPGRIDRKILFENPDRTSFLPRQNRQIANTCCRGYQEEDLHPAHFQNVPL